MCVCLSFGSVWSSVRKIRDPNHFRAFPLDMWNRKCVTEEKRASGVESSQAGKRGPSIHPSMHSNNKPQLLHTRPPHPRESRTLVLLAGIYVNLRECVGTEGRRGLNDFYQWLWTLTEAHCVFLVYGVCVCIMW